MELIIELDRTKRVKEARDEAKKEIDEYKKSKDEEFKKFEAEVSRSAKSHSCIAQLNTDFVTAFQR